MRANVLGRVQNTQLSVANALNPLFEAVINSIDAINEAGLETRDGEITVRILRAQDALALPSSDDHEPEQGSIIGFEVADNGIGFTDRNFESFNESDTLYKASRGGKGVGRFLWLKAFHSAEVDSVFSRNGDLCHRSFVFSLATPDGVSGHVLQEGIESAGDRRTTVRLLHVRDRYSNGIPSRASTIASRIVEHCLEYFVLGRMPPIRILDVAAEQEIDLHVEYENITAENDEEVLPIGDIRLRINHFLLNARANIQHRIYYCAHQRVVRNVNLQNRIAHLPTTLDIEDEGSFIYAAYVSSEYLDNNVNQERTDFILLPADGIQFVDEPGFEEVEETVIEASRRFLRPYTMEVRDDTVTRTTEYVRSDAPQYRYILDKHPEVIDQIPPEATVDEIDSILHKATREIEETLSEEAEHMLSEDVLSEDGFLDQEKWDEIVSKWVEYNGIGKATLAKYIVHRKAMLLFLEHALGLQVESGRFALEEVVHRVIFPLRATSDEVAYDDHNLWIIDEKLAYHEYLSSDRPLSQVDVLVSDSQSRPDLLVFDQPIAVVDEEPPYLSGIVIFEFKRPQRNDYSPSENPIHQVYDYVRQIKEGRAEDKAGRRIRIPDTVPFYCYVVCDLTPGLEELSEDYGLTSTPDSGGYFGYNPNLGAYIEIIDFNKLLRDAKQRNRVLFDKLNLPPRIDNSVQENG